MARVFTDGAEMNDMLFWDYYGASFVVASATPDPFDGDFYYEGGWGHNCYHNIPSLTELYVRCRVYLQSTIDTRTTFPSFPPTQIYLACNPYRKLCAYGNGITEESDLTMNPDQWYLIEAHIKIADNPNGIIQVKVDGTQVIDFTGDTLYSYGTSVTAINFSAYNTLDIDDLALNDTTGGVDDSWCGDGSIVKVYPNGNGTHNNWHGSDGNDVNNFELVDEFPNDADTTYVSHDSSASGTQDQYAMSDYSGSGYTISRIYAEARARLTAPSANTLKLGVLPNGSTDQMSSGISLPVGAYKRVVGDEYRTNPADAGAWEEADIDALEGVIEVG